MHAKMIGKNNTCWLRHGEKTLLGIVKASAPYGTEDHLPMFFFKQL